MRHTLFCSSWQLVSAVLVTALFGGPCAWGQAAALMPTNVAGMSAICGPVAGFDPTTASNAELSRFGFPKRPDATVDPAAYTRWSQAMHAAHRRIMPVIGPLARRAGRMRPGAGPRSFITRPSNIVTMDTLVWSGLALQDVTLAPGPHGFTNIAAEFNVPIPQTPPGQCPAYSLDADIWVGIDGFAQADPGILQAGVDDYIQCDSVYGTFSGALPWFEWYPGPPHLITNLQVTPGDVFYVAVNAINSTTASAFLLDESSGEYASIQFPAPAGMQLAGDSAEWIVEAPAAALPNYVATWFDGMSVTTGDAKTYGTAYSPALGTINLITMDDTTGVPISSPQILGKSSMVMHTQGALTVPLTSSN